MLLFILWAVLAVGGWLAIVADSRKKGMGWRECNKQGAQGALGLSFIFLIGWLIWGGSDDAAAPEKPAEVQEVKAWYEGGNLHNAGALDWQQATFENKLATCADFIAGLSEGGEFNAKTSSRISGRESLKPLARDLVKALDKAFAPAADAAENAQIYANQGVVDGAVMAMVTMGWMDDLDAQNRAPEFDKAAILESVKGEAYKKYTDTDGFDIYFDGYQFGEDDATTLALEFKPDYILLAISFISDESNVQEEERLLKIAQAITATITGSDRDLVSENRAGVLTGDFWVNGVKCGSVGPIGGHSTLHFYHER